jgi:hypothetical protein
MPIKTELLEAQIICSHYVGAISEREMTKVVQGKGKVEKMTKKHCEGNCVLIVDLSQVAQLDSIIGYLPMHLGSVAKSMKGTIVVKPQDLMGSMLLTSMLSAAPGLDVALCDSIGEALRRARTVRDNS